VSKKEYNIHQQRKRKMLLYLRERGYGKNTYDTKTRIDELLAFVCHEIGIRIRILARYFI
jgi:hypothetical protein